MWALPVSDALIDEISIARRPDACADPEERVESAARVASSVPAIYELVETAPDMGLAQAVKDAPGPALQVREDAGAPNAAAHAPCGPGRRGPRGC